MGREVVFVLHTLAIGGAERHASMIANYFAEHGVSVHIVLLDNSEVRYKFNAGVNVYSLNCSENTEKCKSLGDCREKIRLSEKTELKVLRLFKSKKQSDKETEYYLKYSFVTELKSFFEQHSDAAVISFMNVPTISSAMALTDLPNRFIFFEFNDPNCFFSDKGFYHTMRKYIKRADAGIFQTDDEKDFYGFTDSFEKYVIPNPLDCREFPEPYTSEREKKIVNFCRIEDAKNIPMLIDAFELLHKDYPEYSVEIYGDGSRKQSVIDCAEKKKLSDCVSILPARRDVLNYVKNAAMFVSTSNREGISNSMLEAMAIGLPCICTDCPAGGARMMIDDRKNGLLVPMNDAEALYKAMKELIENPELSDKISKNAVEIREKLEPDKICSQITEAVFGNGGKL